MSKEFITDPTQIVDGQYYALPHEVDSLEMQLDKYFEIRQAVAQRIIEGMWQSLEPRHPNDQPNLFHSERDYLDKRIRQLTRIRTNLKQVEYPNPDFGFVTIGTRVSYTTESDESKVDIVGNIGTSLFMFEQEKAKDDYINVASLNSPMSKALLGKSPGSKVVVNIGSTPTEVSILGIDQGAQQSRYLQTLAS